MAEPLRAKILWRYREGGAVNVLAFACRYLRFHKTRLWLAAIARLHRLSPWNRTFRLGDNTYRYFYHPHNTTWRNERCVEIPVAAKVFRAWSGKRILEVGNVLQNYMPASHTVLDKYERADGVINQDVLDFQPTTRFDLILCISTLEHVGWDEGDLDPDKARTAFAHLTDMLAPGGRLWVSIPRGYNRYLDRQVDEGALPFTDLVFLRRTSPRYWHQVAQEDVQGIPYGVGYPGAIAVAIGTFDKP
jgi:SAM-dependent methyltransferase